MAGLLPYLHVVWGFIECHAGSTLCCRELWSPDRTSLAFNGGWECERGGYPSGVYISEGVLIIIFSIALE